MSVPCILESTGMYHLPVALMVTNAGYRVNCINPLITKRYQRSSVRNAKTDTIDALRLATIGVQEVDLPIFRADPKMIEARKIVGYIGKLETVKGELVASMKALLHLKSMTGLSVDLRETKEALKELDGQIKTLLKEVSKRIPQDTIEKILIKGVSAASISRMLSIICDKDFKSRDALVAFVGLDVMPRESGMWKGRGRLSKRGNGYARKILFQMAWGLKQHNPEYKKKYDELRQRGLNYKTCLLSLSRKYLRFVYGQLWKKS